MKRLCLFLLAAAPLFAQMELYQRYNLELSEVTSGLGAKFTTELVYEVVVIDHVKTLLWYVQYCEYPPLFIPLTPEQIGILNKKPCIPLPDSENSVREQYSGVNAKLDEFYDEYPDGDDKYHPFALRRSKSAAHRELTNTVAPVAPPNPRMILLDGLGNSLLAVDMTNLKTVSQVVVPSTSGPLGIRPAITGPANEVWVANAGLEVSVVDLASQTLLTNILTPSVPQASSPVNIVFDAQGETAFEAIQFSLPDSSGNTGALLIFDAANRTVKSTLLLKYGPTALVMAPDGSTLYILDGRGMLTYYDVLSGTADLSVSTFTPGQLGGTTTGPLFIHPDGTRLFWNINNFAFVFDLTTRKVIAQFNSGLPGTSGVAMTMSQDGGRVYLSNGAGAVVIMETKYGNILKSSNKPGQSSLVFGGPPIAP
jgi:hypothetical protein